MKKAAFLLFILAIASCCNCNDKKNLQVSIIPEPAEIEVTGGSLNLDRAVLWMDPAFYINSHKAVVRFYEQLGAAKEVKA